MAHKTQKGLILLILILAFCSFCFSVKQSQNQMSTASKSAVDSKEKHSCNYAIQLWKKGAADYKSIIKENKNWFDIDFAARTERMIYWNDRQSGHLEWRDWSKVKVVKMSDKYQESQIFGSSSVVSYTDDTVDKVIADSYFISALYALSENQNRLKKLFVTQELNQAGVVAINAYVRGKPNIITIDEYNPITTELIFSKVGVDGSLWAPLLEKAWAKTNGNYERIQYGSSYEALRFLTGCPVQFYDLSKHNEDSIWRILQDADMNNFVTLANTGASIDGKSTNELGLSKAHSYTILGAFYLNSQNMTEQRILKIRNSWIKDKQLNASNEWSTLAGSYNSSDYFRQRTGIENNSTEEGIFLIELSEFMKNFESVDICNVHDDWHYSYYEKLNDDQYKSTYHFTIKKPQEAFIALDFYNPRMYSPGCKTWGETTGTLTLKFNGTIIDEVSDSSDWSYLSIHSYWLEAGTYELTVDIDWAQVDEKDYTISVYALDRVILKDSEGKTNQNGKHDYQYITPSKSKKEIESARNNVDSNHNVEMRSKLNKIMANQRENLAYKADYWYYTYFGILNSNLLKEEKDLVFIIGDTSLAYYFEVEISITAKKSKFEYTEGNDKCRKVTDEALTDYITCTCEINPKVHDAECAIIVQGSGVMSHSFELINWSYV